LLPNNVQLEQNIHDAQRALHPFFLKDYHKDTHITLYAAGFLQNKKCSNDDVTIAILDQQEQCIRHCLASRLPLRTQALNSFQGAAFIEVMDATGKLTLLHQTLCKHFGSDRDAPLTPHITLGLYNKAYTTTRIAQQLQQFPAKVIPFHCDSIHLLAYSSADIRSPLQSLRCIKLNL